MQDTSASQSVRALAARGDRARRVSAARTLIGRIAPAAAALACVASVVAPVLGGPKGLGLFILAGAVIASGLTVLTARYYRHELGDRAVAELDRAANLEGALRSAHWFAWHAAAGGPEAPWIARHLEDTANRVAGVDWSRVYERPVSRLRLTVTVACIAAAVGLSFTPLPRIMRPATQARNETAPPPESGRAAPDAPAALVPQILDGMKAMAAGQRPSEQQLKAIGQALETARHDPAARKRIEGEVRGSNANQTEARSSSSSDSDSGAWSNDYQNGFEMSDLDWAYQEAMARGRNDDAPRQEPGEVTGGRDPNDASGRGRRGEPAASGEATGAPVQGDTRGRPIDVSSLLLGRQQASAGSGMPDPAQDIRPSAKLTAALRAEVVHASSDVTLPNPDQQPARRATNASQTTAGAPLMTAPVQYDRSRAVQPPAVPAARRPLLREFFLRSADPVSPVKRP